MDNKYFGTASIYRILLKLAPPIMVAQLIQGLYNIVDSFFIGRYSTAGLNALSVIYPVQNLITAIAIGTGVGVNTVMSRFFGQGEKNKAKETSGCGNVIAFCTWVIFALLSLFFLEPYINISISDESSRNQCLSYGRIVCLFSLGIFMESMWTKIHQSKGNMNLPMIAQVSGAIVNIVLDPILIFGNNKYNIPSLGIEGAAIATVAGQWVAAVIVGISGFTKPCPLKVFGSYTKLIYTAAMPSIFMQIMYTVYIIGLNLILSSFTDAAVTVLGLYYKIQSLFFIPLVGLQTCIVPIISYNYAAKSIKRCHKILFDAIIFTAVSMIFGLTLFEVCPKTLLNFFTSDSVVLEIGAVGFRIIATSFIPASFSLFFPVYFQAVGENKKSVFLTILRHIILFVPVAYVLHFFGLSFVWFTFPITEVITAVTGAVFYYKFYNGFFVAKRS